jgi:hypothetical protein
MPSPSLFVGAKQIGLFRCNPVLTAIEYPRRYPRNQTKQPSENTEGELGVLPHLCENKVNEAVHFYLPCVSSSHTKLSEFFSIKADSIRKSTAGYGEFYSTIRGMYFEMFPQGY